MADGLGAVILYVFTLIYSLLVGGVALLVLGVRNRPRSTFLGVVCGFAGLVLGSSLGGLQGAVGLVFGVAGFVAGFRVFPRDVLPVLSGRVFGVVALLVYAVSVIAGLVLFSIFVSEGLLLYTVSQLSGNTGAAVFVIVASVTPVVAGVAGLWLEWRRSKT